MKILGMIEKRLSASLFDAEWEIMSNKYNKQRYISFSDREKTLPKIFNALYITIDVICAAFIVFKFLL